MSLLPIALALAVALVAEPSPAEVEQAKDLYLAGSEAYRQGEYPVAIRAYEEARRLASHHAITFSLAQTYRLQYFVDGDTAKLARAVELYREYLKSVDKGGRREHAAQHLSTLVPMLDRGDKPAIPVGPRRPEAKETLARLIVSSGTDGATARLDGGDAAEIPATFEVAPGEHRVLVEAAGHVTETRKTRVPEGVIALNVDLQPEPGRVEVQAPLGAAIWVDGRAVGESPLPDSLEVAAGRHLVTVTEHGREAFLQQIEIGRGQLVRVDAELAVTTQRVAAYAMYGVAVALLGGAGVSTALAISKENEAVAFEQRLESLGTEDTEIAEFSNLRSARDDFAAAAIGLGVGGAVAAATGLVLWLFDSPATPRAPVLVPSAGPSGGGMTAGFTF